MFDKDGYPTDAILAKLNSLANDYTARKETIKLIRDLWYWGEPWVTFTGSDLFLSTGGWSGNESVVGALRDTMFWWLYWQKSERGGHYHFSGWKEEDDNGDV